ncbi:MAG: hypothetical protein AB1458_15005 [Bacteroidota bacterium]
MKRPLLACLLFLPCSAAIAQSSYWGFTFDHNSSLHNPNTFAFGVDIQARIKRSNWYFNWHYSAGQNTNMELYNRANITILLYGNPDYWEYSFSDCESLGEFFGLLLFPAVCPIGVTNYFYNSPSGRLRAGFYLNPLQLDQWDMGSRQITSWSVDGGFRFLFNTHKTSWMYLSFGGMQLNNIGSNPDPASNKLLFNFSVGNLWGSAAH